MNIFKKKYNAEIEFSGMKRFIDYHDKNVTCDAHFAVYNKDDECEYTGYHDVVDGEVIIPCKTDGEKYVTVRSGHMLAAHWVDARLK